MEILEQNSIQIQKDAWRAGVKREWNYATALSKFCCQLARSGSAEVAEPQNRYF
jgi:hypothetical protein